MMKQTLCILSAILLFSACTPTNSGNKNGVAKNEIVETIAKTTDKMTKYFPFELRDNGGQRFVIVAETESAALYPKYANFFEKYGYSGNGYCWEGHIIQILEKIDPGLLQHIDFDPEAGAFFAYADTEASQMKFVELLSPIFTDLSKLEEYVKMADRSRIDD